MWFCFLWKGSCGHRCCQQQIDVVLSLVQSGGWIWSPHSHGERGERSQNGQTKGTNAWLRWAPPPITTITTTTQITTTQWTNQKNTHTNWPSNVASAAPDVSVLVEVLVSYLKEPKQTPSMLPFKTLIAALSTCSQKEIKILSTSVFVDPYEEADAQVCHLVYAKKNVYIKMYV